MSWQEEDLGEGKKGLIRTFEFADFKEAWSFMSEVAELAEAHQHHPNWTNVYNRVTILLSTHDADDFHYRKRQSIGRGNRCLRRIR